MSNKADPGIDYGLGKANVDPDTGIRYGVISINSLHEFIHDELEPEYGDPTCPKCGDGVQESSFGKDYYCESCASLDEIEPTRENLEPYTFYSDECFSDECVGLTLNEVGKHQYSAHSAFDGACLFLTKSSYYTFAKFCSPCAPGAGDLDNPIEDGVKTFCFGPSMFTDDKAPYPVYRVSDDSLVE